MPLTRIRYLPAPPRNALDKGMSALAGAGLVPGSYGSMLRLLVKCCDASQERYFWLVSHVQNETVAAFCHHAGARQQAHAEILRALLTRVGLREVARPKRGLRRRWREWWYDCRSQAVRRQALHSSREQAKLLHACLEAAHRYGHEDVALQLQEVLDEELRQRDWLANHEEDLAR